MKQTYQLSGMTCGGCEAKVKSALLRVDGVDEVSVSKENEDAVITSSKIIPITTLQAQLLQLDNKYNLSNSGPVKTVDSTKSWFETYKPILLIFGYIFTVTALIEFTSEHINYTRWMRHFMAGFFLTFSFFKLINLKGFKESYQMYDVIARRIPAWGYIYVFVELVLGIAYLIDFNPVVTNSVAFIVMSLSIIGVLQTVLNKKIIKCACLGDVFNLPMSTVTIIEDGLMMIMSLMMLIMALQ